MTKDRLRSLSYKELSYIAENGNITVFQNLDKEALVSLVFEALEEERLDREGNNNLTIQVEAKKYTVSQDQELFVDFGDNVELPERYAETRIVLMLRDPSWVYCYWDLEDRILNELNDSSDYSGLILRVTELAVPNFGQKSCVDWFDIPIHFDDLRRYINLPSENAFYGAEIYAQLGEKASLIVRSNIVKSSRDYIAPIQGTADTAQSKLIGLSGFSTDIGSFPGSGYIESHNPQRIMTIAGEVESNDA